MDFNTQVKLLIFFMMVSYGISLTLLLHARVKKDKQEKIKIRRESKAYKQFSARLQDVVKSSQEKMDEEDKVFLMIGRKSSFIRNIRKSLLKTFSGGVFGTQVIRMLFLAFIGSIVVFLLSMVLLTPIIAVAFLIICILSSLTAVNSYKMMKELTIYDQVSNFMTINYSQYLSSANFEESIEKTLAALRPGTFSYAVTSNFRSRVFEFNVPLDRAIQNMKDEFTNISHIEQYLDIVYKAETIDPAYKASVGGIPDNFSMDMVLKKDFTFGVVLISGASLVMNAVAIAYSIIASQASLAFNTALKDPKGIAMITFGAIGLAVMQLIIFRTSSKSMERVWDDE